MFKECVSIYKCYTFISNEILQARAMEYGFDNIFVNGPTPTPSAVGLPTRKKADITNLTDGQIDGGQHNMDGNNV